MNMRGYKKLFGVSVLSAAVAALFFLHSPLASAHARWKLDGPIKPRSTATGLKTAQCGGVARTANAVTFAPGQVLEVVWEETTDHPGYYRIAFSPATDTDFDSHILIKNFPDTQGGQLPHIYTTTITLPTEPCDACTLQLIQVMTESTPPTNYYSCSDIKLAATGGGGTTPTPMPTPTPTPAPIDLNELAQILLDDFTSADTDKNSMLTHAEIQLIFSEFTLDQFNRLDGNHNGLLTKAELSAVINPPTPTPKTEAKAAAASMDWIALLAALPFGLRRMRARLAKNR